MPSVRILNWNVENLSQAKANIPGIISVIGRTIVDMQADVVVLLEIRAASALAVMTAISAAARNALGAAAGALYTGWLVSYETGRECYGLLIRDMNEVRPIRVTGGVNGQTPPLSNLDQSQFGTWPVNFPALPPAALPAAAARPRLPLIDLYASTPPTGRKRKRFDGQTIGNGGYSLGIGFRMPCLILLKVHGFAVDYVIPIVACHLGAVRGGANALARSQLSQYKLMHISQMYSNPAVLANQGFLWVDGAAGQVTNIIFTGDFNIDFLQNSPAGNAMVTGNNAAFATQTPTLPNGGSNVPAALGPPAAAVPGAPPGAPFPNGPVADTILNLALRTAVTTGGTILHHYDPTFAPPNMDALRGACFDNFFYGGSALSPNQQLHGPGTDAGLIRNMPQNIVNGAGPTVANQYNVSGAWTHYMASGTRNASQAPLLNPALPAGALPLIQALIGARFVSDHLPVLLDFQLP